MEIKLASVDSVIVYFDNKISLDVSFRVKQYLEEIKKLEGIIDIVPSYTSILITYDIFIYSYENLVSILEKIKVNNVSSNDNKIVEIPVYYGEEVGLDLKRISEEKNLSIKEIIDIHSSQSYRVYAIGFAPGFAYMGEVDKRININRLENPRKTIPKNSLAIANEQTAIYPQSSPGGWNIIGKTTIEMFDKSLASLCPVNVGDEVKFYSISKEEFLKQGGVL
ncbi:MAG: 5-oxoprolinase subunit PxpB [Campylobacteraceae bacterium]|nr:5-oxoprolinase subunit PxpB [Campylobacteraceae bacterium]